MWLAVSLSPPLSYSLCFIFVSLLLVSLRARARARFLSKAYIVVGPLNDHFSFVKDFVKECVKGVAVCVAVCCGVLWCIAGFFCQKVRLGCRSVFQCAALCCIVLHCAALCCSVLQCVAGLTYPVQTSLRWEYCGVCFSVCCGAFCSVCFNVCCRVCCGVCCRVIDWCCFYYFVRNSLVALLEALCSRIFSLDSWISVFSDIFFFWCVQGL